MRKTALSVKLMGAAAGLAAAAMMLVMGTFAWFNINSTATMGSISISMDGQGPFEVSLDYDEDNPDEATWNQVADLTKNETINKLLEKGVYLRPISTADLEHWYVATYDFEGNVNGLREVRLDEVGNIPFNETFSPSNTDYVEGSANYLFYFDMWIRSGNDDDDIYGLRLSNPAMDSEGEVNLMEGETNYGTYVMWMPTAGGNQNSSAAAASCVRVGFQLFDKENESQSTVYFYEPNADLHPDYGTYTSNPDVGYLRAQNGTDDVKLDTRSTEDALLTTYVPKYQGENSYTMVEQGASVGDELRLFRQKQTVWNEDVISTPEPTDGEDQDDSDEPVWTPTDSTKIATIGDFVDAQGKVLSIDKMYMTRLSRESVQHIRVFFWLEGQDADCWNSAAGGALFANFEFYGEILESAVPDEGGGEEP